MSIRLVTKLVRPRSDGDTAKALKFRRMSSTTRHLLNSGIERSETFNSARTFCKIA